MRNLPITIEEADRVIKRYHFRARTARAVRFFLTGIYPSRTQAAAAAGITLSAAARAIARMTIAKRCECCGQIVQEINLKENEE